MQVSVSADGGDLKTGRRRHRGRPGYMDLSLRRDALDLIGRDRGHHSTVIDRDLHGAPPGVVLLRPRTPTNDTAVDTAVDRDERLGVGLRRVAGRWLRCHTSRLRPTTGGYTPR